MFSPLELDPPVFDVEQKDTTCGHPFYIKGGAGNSCVGASCLENGVDTGKVCVNGECKTAVVAGKYEFIPNDRWIDETIKLMVICTHNKYATHRVAFTNMKMYQSNGNYGINLLLKEDYCTNGRYFLQFEINDSWGDDDIYAVVPLGNDAKCDRPLMLCQQKEEEGDEQTVPDPAGSETCPDDYPIKVIAPYKALFVDEPYMDREVLYNYNKLWTFEDLKTIITCDLNLTEDKFPEDYEL
jgi:hypothetical protein